MFEAFHDEVIAVGRRHLPDLNLKAGSMSAELVSGTYTLRLDHLFAKVHHLSRDERESAIVDWLSNFTHAANAELKVLDAKTDTWEQAEKLLRPKLLGPISEAMRDKLIYQPYVGDLVVIYAMDLGKKDLYVSRRKAALWCKAQDLIHAHAVDNLERMSVGMGSTPVGSKGGIINIRMFDGYDAARLILPGLRAELLKTLGSPFYAGVPARDLFMAWSKANDKHQRAMAKAVRAAAADMGHRVSDRVYVVDEQGVRPA